MNQIVAIAAKAVEEAEELKANPFEVYNYLKEAKDELEKAIKQMNELIFLQIEKGENTYDGYEYKKMEGRKTFEFKTNPQWVELNNKIKPLEDKLKALAINTNGMAEITDTDTGEIIKLPLIKQGDPFIQRTKIKQKA